MHRHKYLIRNYPQNTGVSGDATTTVKILTVAAWDMAVGGKIAFYTCECCFNIRIFQYTSHFKSTYIIHLEVSKSVSTRLAIGGRLSIWVENRHGIILFPSQAFQELLKLTEKLSWHSFILSEGTAGTQGWLGFCSKSEWEADTLTSTNRSLNFTQLALRCTDCF